MSRFTLEDLVAIVDARTGSDAAASYTRSLLDKGPARVAKKFGEEAVEMVIAATQGERAPAIAEAADVIYHLVVLLRSLDIQVSDVLDELQRRTAQSGHAEKESRQHDLP